MFDVGDQVRVSVTFTTTNGGTNVDPTNVTLKIKKPNGQVLQYIYPSGISKDFVGIYYRDFEVTDSGRYYYRWEGDGENPSATESWFVVKESEFS